jgi:hypothetical protein
VATATGGYKKLDGVGIKTKAERKKERRNKLGK